MERVCRKPVPRGQFHWIRAFPKGPSGQTWFQRPASGSYQVNGPEGKQQ